MNYRESILSSDDRKIEKLDIPEWACKHVFVRTLSAIEGKKMHAATLEDEKKADGESTASARVVATVVCTESGERVFTDADIPSLAKKSLTVLNRILNFWNKMSRVEVGEIEKKS